MIQENGAILYNIDELPESAKEKAREHIIEIICNENLYTVENFSEIAEIIGIDIKDYNSKYGRYNVFYQIDGQGSGACFAGDYSYVPDSSKKIRENYNDIDLFEIVDNLAALQAKYNNEINIRIIHVGNYYHENSMDFSIDWDSSSDDFYVSDEDENKFIQEFKNLAKWLYNKLYTEYYDRISNDSLDEFAQANEMLFLINGTTI